MADDQMRLPPRNPYLADSICAIAHNEPSQQDTVGVAGPVGPTAHVTDRIRSTPIGPGPAGPAISSPYPDGRRVIWLNPRGRIVKLDYDTLEVLAVLELDNGPAYDLAAHEAAIVGLDTLTGMEAIGHAATLSVTYLVGVTGVYYVLDCDNTYFIGYDDHVAAFGDAVSGDRSSPIVRKGTFVPPPEVTGKFVGMNMTFDGWLAVSTENGWVLTIARDFREHHAIQIRHSEGAKAFTDQRFAELGRGGASWVRKSLCLDEDGGIYLPSNDHLHKVIWTGDRLSIDEADGAWTAEYRNENGFGCGTTPSLMGFGDEDRFVMIGDGSNVVNIVIMWRDEIPADWQQLPGAPSRRIAGMGRADMGNPDLPEIQTEQSITVCGYGAMTVNNEPRTIPPGFPSGAKRALVFWLGHLAEFRPVGLHKYQWHPETRTFEHAWANTEVSSPNGVPSVSQPVDTVYTVGSRDGEWTLEGIDWTTGESRFHYVLGSSRYNTLGSSPQLDQEGRVIWSGPFGFNRLGWA